MFISDVPTKTATGTIAIQVEDFNDHCPELTTTTHTMCFEDNVIYATAVDKDELPNSTPFEFTVIAASSSGEWTVEHLNGEDEPSWPLSDENGVSRNQEPTANTIY